MQPVLLSSASATPAAVTGCVSACSSESTSNRRSQPRGAGACVRCSGGASSGEWDTRGGSDRRRDRRRNTYRRVDSRVHGHDRRDGDGGHDAEGRPRHLLGGVDPPEQR